MISINTIKRLLYRLWRMLTDRKPMVYLGALVVAPRNDGKRHLEEIVAGQTGDLPEALHDAMAELFSLRSVADRPEPHADDLVLDIVITHHQAGGLEVADIMNVPIPIGWRTSLSLTGRISLIETNQPVKTYEVSEKESWSEFMKLTPSSETDWRSLFWKPPFEDERLNQLLYRATIRLFKMVKNDI